MEAEILTFFHLLCRSFRLQSERPFKKLMIDNHGCSQDNPGIGNIAYVKDIRSDKIVTTAYRCSVFGKYQHPLTGFGWVGKTFSVLVQTTVTVYSGTLFSCCSFYRFDVFRRKT